MKRVSLLVMIGFSMLIARPADAQMMSRGDGLVRVQSNISFFQPGPTGEGEEAQKTRDQARRTIYGMAARECDLLRETLAKDCRLEAVNANVNANRGDFGRPQPEGYTVNGSISLQITAK